MFYWFLDDIGSFFRHYVAYRTVLTDFARELGIKPPSGADMDQVVDMIHTVWLGRNFNDGVLKYAVRLLLGDPIATIPGPQIRVPMRDPSSADPLTHRVRRYVWREEVVRAEPRDEILIARTEMDLVIDQLDLYFEE